MQMSLTQLVRNLEDINGLYVFYLLMLIQLIMCICCLESSGNAADHSLDLSLGNPASKQNSVEFGEDRHDVAMDPATMPFEPNWQNQGLRPKVQR